MRLTPDMIEKAEVFLNPTYEVELCLRGNKIPTIENLGVTEDYHESIDLSDNEISKLENFPLLTRLKSLYLSNNRITRIATNLHSALPRIESLILSNNRINRLGDLDPLSSLSSLRTLSLLHNPVTKLKHYRIYVVNLLPKLTNLDFSKVKWKERLLARKLFGGEKGKKAKDTFSSYQASVSSSSSSNGRNVKPSKEDVKAAISGATSLSQIKQIETALITGDRLPQPKGAPEGSGKGKEKEEGEGGEGEDVAMA